MSVRAAVLEDRDGAGLACGEHSEQEVSVTTTQAATSISAFVPGLTVDDLQKSIAFYEALGFTVNDRWEDRARCSA